MDLRWLVGMVMLGGCHPAPAEPPVEASVDAVPSESAGTARSDAPPPPEPAPPPALLPPDEASDALLQAAKEGDLEAVRRHAAVPGVDLDTKVESEFTKNHSFHGYTALTYAAYRDDLEMFDFLVERGARVEPRLLLLAAARGGSVRIARRVFERGDVEKDDVSSALAMACTHPSEEVVELLLDHGAAIDDLGWAGGEGKSRCLVEATALGDVGWIETVLAHGADIDGADEAGYTALMVAAGLDPDDTSVVERLLDAGANPRLRSSEGERAVDLAEPGSAVHLVLRRAKKRRPVQP